MVGVPSNQDNYSLWVPPLDGLEDGGATDRGKQDVKEMEMGIWLSVRNFRNSLRAMR